MCSKVWGREDGGDDQMKEVRIWEKIALTVEEAAAYSNIGTHKLREITDKDDKQLVLWVGSKRLIKRKALEKYIDQSYSI